MYDRACKHCGKFMSEFYSTGMLGCKHCYECFLPAVEEYISRTQASNKHVGKTPKLSSVDRDLLNKYNMLNQEKERAGLEGRFNDMAKISKEIFSLKDQLIKRGLIR